MAGSRTRKKSRSGSARAPKGRDPALDAPDAWKKDASSWEHRTVETNGIRLHVVTAGGKARERPLVVLLHGFPQCWYAWRRQIPALAKRFRVVVPDLRGYGASDKPPRVRDYALPALSADIAGLIEALGEERAFVAGHDWGGGVAWDLAMRYPERVERLAILNCPHPHKFRRTLFSSPAQFARSWYMYFFQLPLLPEWRFRADGGKVFRRIFRGLARDKRAFTDEDLAVLTEAMLQPDALRSAINYYRASFRNPFAARTLGTPPPVRARTLILWAEEDSALGIELTRGLERYFAAPFEVEYVPGCSHWIMEERPTLVSERLVSFFSA